MYFCQLLAGNRIRGTKAVIVFDVLIPVQLDKELVMKLHKLIPKMWGCSPRFIETEWIIHEFFLSLGKSESNLGAEIHKAECSESWGITFSPSIHSYWGKSTCRSKFLRSRVKNKWFLMYSISQSYTSCVNMDIEDL